MPAPLTIEQILAKHRKRGECLIWTGAVSSAGYGVLHFRRKLTTAHRFAFEASNGQVPDGAVVMHTCDNRACINPAHLKLGTQQANLHDMWDKGRAPNGKLRPEQVAAIRARFVSGDPFNGASALGREFGVTHKAILKVVNGESWPRL